MHGPNALDDASVFGSLPYVAWPSKHTWIQIIAVVCLAWYAIVTSVASIGYIQLQRHYSNVSVSAVVAVNRRPDSKLPAVTVIRPVKGIEPYLYQCLEATFKQTYPASKITVFFCIESRHDPARPILERLVADYPSFNVKILVADDDPGLNGRDGSLPLLGPNPKIRNMSRAYREAKSDIVWIIDCNVWVDKSALAKMVDTLECEGSRPKNKFVHQLPLVVDVTERRSSDRKETHEIFLPWLKKGCQGGLSHSALSSTVAVAYALGGGRLEEAFMSSAHAKFYTAINTVLIAPCIVGKSTMFRRSHLDYLTSSMNPHRRGIDFFSDNICEDHLIGDLLWRGKVPEEKRGEAWGKHALVFGALAIQPMANMSIASYIARRVRWLRVRKFTVTLATLVEPGTESIICSLCGAFAVTTLPWFHDVLGVPQTWTFLWALWTLSFSGWALTDWTLFKKLQSASSIDVDENTPEFARPPFLGSKRAFASWLLAWLGREILAFPIWFWAVYGGTRVTWRGKTYWVGIDMKVHEVRKLESSKTK